MNPLPPKTTPVLQSSSNPPTNGQPTPSQINSWVSETTICIQQKSQTTLHPETPSQRRHLSCKLYHFTDKTSYEAILESGKIKMSTCGLNTACGPGVYLTSMPPNGSFSKLQIAKNNYHAIYEQKMEKVFNLFFLQHMYIIHCSAVGDFIITWADLMST